MKAEELAVIKERADKATEGPWILSPEVCGPEGQGVFNVEDFGCICEVGDPYPRGNNRPQENMEFIANARQDIPKLVAEVERLQNKLSLHMLGKRNLDAMIAHKDEEIARLRKALEFYANEEIYENPILHEDEDGTLHCDHSDAELDNGKRAREALE